MGGKSVPVGGGGGGDQEAEKLDEAVRVECWEDEMGRCFGVIARM
jgi:hypothetical protein